MTGLQAFNFKQWINDHRHLLKPPVGNKVVWKNRELIVMVVGGPNIRTDYHINEGEEFFYQLEGGMVLRILDENGRPKDVPIDEGEILLLPPKVPHSPQRFENTVGLVVERRRRPEEDDGLKWICPQCHRTLYEEYFHLSDIETQLPPVFKRFYGGEHAVCGDCHLRVTKSGSEPA